MRFEIAEAKPWHCGEIARRLRLEHARAVRLLGVDTHRALLDAFRGSCFRRAWLGDGKLFGLGGVVGSPFGQTGAVWLALAEEATRYPRAIVREARQQLDALSATRSLVTTLIDGDEAANRFAAFLGFTPCGVRVGSLAVFRYVRRT